MAFAAVARSADGSTVTGLRYDASAADGERLIVTGRSSAGDLVDARPSLPDWLLLPIVAFADSPHDACVTLFGEAEDSSLDLVRHGKIISYHPAFQDTLLGLRLLQLDMLILHPDAADLFKSGDGAYLLGSSEALPDLAGNRRNFTSVRKWADRQRATFQSYVVMDDKRGVRFSLRARGLQLTGEPFWDAWRFRETAYNQARSTLTQEMLADVDLLGEEEAQEKYTDDYIQNRVSAILDEIPARKKVDNMVAYERRLTARIRSANGINPAVYSAGIATMRYAAFFRYVKKQAPAAWESFLVRVKAERLPPVETPGVWLQFAAAP